MKRSEGKKRKELEPKGEGGLKRRELEGKRRGWKEKGT